MSDHHEQVEEFVKLWRSNNADVEPAMPLQEAWFDTLTTEATWWITQNWDKLLEMGWEGIKKIGDWLMEFLPDWIDAFKVGMRKELHETEELYDIVARAAGGGQVTKAEWHTVIRQAWDILLTTAVMFGGRFGAAGLFLRLFRKHKIITPIVTYLLFASGALSDIVLPSAVAAEMERKDAEAEAVKGAQPPAPAAPAAALDLESIITNAANRNGVPPQILLATAMLESGTTIHKPTGSGARKTFYPMGLQKNRARGIMKQMGVPQPDDAGLEQLLSDPMQQVELAAYDLGRGWRKYKNYKDANRRIRAYWAAPAIARKAKNFYDEEEIEGLWSGSVPWKRRFARWDKALEDLGIPKPKEFS